MSAGSGRLALALLATVSTGLAAQTGRPGPLIPLGSRADRLTTWVIAEGALPGVDPLARPFRLAAVRRAAAAQDTLALAPSARRAFGWLQDALAAFDTPALLVAEVAGQSYTNGRRDSFRPGGGGGTYPAAGFFAAASGGPFAAVLNPAVEGRLWDDPEYTGSKSKRAAGRMQSAYVAAAGERGELVFGRVARDWGPGLFEGLVLSPSAYAYETLYGALRFGRFEISGIAMQLDPAPDTTAAAGPPFNRFWFAHRLTVRAGRRVWLAIYETGVYGGAGQGFQPALHNPLNLALSSEINDNLSVNILVGADVAAQLAPRLRVSASGFLDDIQIDHTTLRDQRPTSYGFSGLVQAGLRGVPAHLSVGYTRVASLTYRNQIDPNLGYTLRDVGIGRNFSDYDQWLVRAELRPGPWWYVAADLSRLRQGSGDFRLPFPNDSVLALPGQGFLVAPVRAANGVRLTVGGEPRAGVELRGELGLTQRLSGGTQTIAAVGVHARFDALARRMGGAAYGIEPGANRAWP